MQQFPCPFCGLRDEREFHFAAEAGKIRPDTTQPVNADAWSNYRFMQRNTKGRTREIWMHLPCAELFALERDSVTMAVLGSQPLRRDAE
jgi:heterotetrameric sarcosine oxidase delta subunit